MFSGTIGRLKLEKMELERHLEFEKALTRDLNTQIFFLKVELENYKKQLEAKQEQKELPKEKKPVTTVVKYLENGKIKEWKITSNGGISFDFQVNKFLEISKNDEVLFVIKMDDFISMIDESEMSM